MIEWIVEKVEWLFSGVAVSVFGYLFARKNIQNQKSGDNSTNIQSGKDVHINLNKKDD